jgi:hypothetical protein
VRNVTVVSSTTITATFSTSNFTPRGTKSVTVTTLGGTSNSVTYTVN